MWIDPTPQCSSKLSDVVSQELVLMEKIFSEESFFVWSGTSKGRWREMQGGKKDVKNGHDCLSVRRQQKSA